MDEARVDDTPRRHAAKKPVTLLQLVLVAVILVLAGVEQPLAMANEWRLHAGGARATSSDCKVVFHGSGRSGNYEMEVDCVSADGASHHDVESLLFVLWLLNPDRSQPCEVRYDPRWPNLYGTSWGFGCLPSRFVTWLVFEAWLLVAGVALLVVLLRAVWQPLFARRD